MRYWGGGGGEGFGLNSSSFRAMATLSLNGLLLPREASSMMSCIRRVATTCSALILGRSFTEKLPQKLPSGDSRTPVNGGGGLQEHCLIAKCKLLREVAMLTIHLERPQETLCRTEMLFHMFHCSVLKHHIKCPTSWECGTVGMIPWNNSLERMSGMALLVLQKAKASPCSREDTRSSARAFRVLRSRGV